MLVIKEIKQKFFGCHELFVSYKIKFSLDGHEWLFMTNTVYQRDTLGLFGSLQGNIYKSIGTPWLEGL